jgi:hypothetical protein
MVLPPARAGHRLGRPGTLVPAGDAGRCDHLGVGGHVPPGGAHAVPGGVRAWRTRRGYPPRSWAPARPSSRPCAPPSRRPPGSVSFLLAPGRARRWAASSSGWRFRRRTVPTAAPPPPGASRSCREPLALAADGPGYARVGCLLRRPRAPARRGVVHGPPLHPGQPEPALPEPARPGRGASPGGFLASPRRHAGHGARGPFMVATVDGRTVGAHRARCRWRAPSRQGNVDVVFRAPAECLAVALGGLAGHGRRIYIGSVPPARGVPPLLDPHRRPEPLRTRPGSRPGAEPDRFHRMKRILVTGSCRPDRHRTRACACGRPWGRTAVLATDLRTPDPGSPRLRRWPLPGPGLHPRRGAGARRSGSIGPTRCSTWPRSSPPWGSATRSPPTG